MSYPRDAVVEIIRRKESNKNRGSWTLAELAANLTLLYTLAERESGAGKAPFVSCNNDFKDDEKVLLQRWKGVPPKRVGCMDVIILLDELDAWSNPIFVHEVSVLLIDLFRLDT